MFFCTEFSDKNATKLLKKIDELGDIDLCYFDDPTELLLFSMLAINANLFKYKRHVTSVANDRTQSI